MKELIPIIVSCGFDWKGLSVCAGCDNQAGSGGIEF